MSKNKKFLKYKSFDKEECFNEEINEIRDEKFDDKEEDVTFDDEDENLNFD